MSFLKIGDYFYNLAFIKRIKIDDNEIHMEYADGTTNILEKRKNMKEEDFLRIKEKIIQKMDLE